MLYQCFIIISYSSCKNNHLIVYLKAQFEELVIMFTSAFELWSRCCSILRKDLVFGEKLHIACLKNYLLQSTCGPQEIIPCPLESKDILFDYSYISSFFFCSSSSSGPTTSSVFQLLLLQEAMGLSD